MDNTASSAEKQSEAPSNPASSNKQPEVRPFAFTVLDKQATLSSLNLRNTL